MFMTSRPVIVVMSNPSETEANSASRSLIRSISSTDPRKVRAKPGEVEDDDALGLAGVDPPHHLVQQRPVHRAAGDVELVVRRDDLVPVRGRPGADRSSCTYGEINESPSRLATWLTRM
jgi:hypothetical protein